MTTLTEMFSLKGKTIKTIAAYVQRFVDEHYQQVLQDYQTIVAQMI